MKAAILITNFVAVLAALIASVFWFRASQTKLPGIDRTTGKPTGPISMLTINTELVEAARKNRIAASWSAAAAFFGAIAVLLNTI